MDFKLSHGLDAKVNVEVKLSSNQRLVHGFETQLPLYDRAEKAGSSFMLIVRVDSSTARIERVQKLASAARQEGKRVPAILVIDGRRTPPASKA